MLDCEEEPKYKNVLIARYSALGDVAMTVPVVYSACAAYPSVRFVMITQQVASSLFVNAPDNLVVIGVDVKEEYHGPLGQWRLLKQLYQKYQIDAFVDLHDVIRTHILALHCLFLGIPVHRIWKGRESKRELTRRRNKRLHPLCSSRARYFKVFRRFGFKFEESFTSIFATPVDQACFADITAPKAADETWIAVAPFAKHKGKIYPVERMEDVVRRLAESGNNRLFLFGGGEEEKEILRKWAEKYANVLSMAERKHGFPKELALLSCMDVMISMDSANMHLASLVRLPVVSVWGATHPFCGFTGWKQSPDNEVQLDLPCRPCSVFGNRPCFRGDYACLNGITPEMILEKVDNVIRKKKKQS